MTTRRGFAPRLGPGFVVYASTKGDNDGVWKLANGETTELWSASGGRLLGGPALSPDGRLVAFSVERRDRKELHVIDVDGAHPRVITDALDLRGTPAWAPDGRALASAVQVGGVPRLLRIGLDGATAPLGEQYAIDPAWSPDGALLVYSGADIGTRFSVLAVTPAAKPYPLRELTLTRGARRMRFAAGEHTLVVMRGEIQHKDLWQIDLDSGHERRLTTLPAGFDVQDFDLSTDGREVILERVEEQSHVVSIDRGGR